MTTRRVALSISASILSFATWAQAQAPDFDRVYTQSEFAGFYGGISAIYLTSSDWDEGLGAGLELGYRFVHEDAAALRHGPNLESGYYRIEADGADFQMIPLTANYRIAAEVVDHIWLYAGGGAGMAFVEIDPDGLSSGSDQTGTWQLFLGMEGPINEWASVRGGYRHMWIDSMRHGDTRISGDDASIFELGVNFWY